MNNKKRITQLQSKMIEGTITKEEREEYNTMLKEEWVTK